MSRKHGSLPYILYSTTFVRPALHAETHIWIYAVRLHDVIGRVESRTETEITSGTRNLATSPYIFCMFRKDDYQESQKKTKQ